MAATKRQVATLLILFLWHAGTEDTTSSNGACSAGNQEASGQAMMQVKTVDSMLRDSKYNSSTSGTVRYEAGDLCKLTKQMCGGTNSCTDCSRCIVDTEDECKKVPNTGNSPLLYVKGGNRAPYNAGKDITWTMFAGTKAYTHRPGNCQWTSSLYLFFNTKNGNSFSLTNTWFPVCRWNMKRCAAVPTGMKTPAGSDYGGESLCCPTAWSVSDSQCRLDADASASPCWLYVPAFSYKQCASGDNPNGASCNTIQISQNDWSGKEACQAVVALDTKQKCGEWTCPNGLLVKPGSTYVECAGRLCEERYDLLKCCMEAPTTTRPPTTTTAFVPYCDRQRCQEMGNKDYDCCALAGKGGCSKGPNGEHYIYSREVFGHNSNCKNTFCPWCKPTCCKMDTCNDAHSRRRTRGKESCSTFNNNVVEDGKSITHCQLAKGGAVRRRNLGGEAFDTCKKTCELCKQEDSEDGLPVYTGIDYQDPDMPQCTCFNPTSDTTKGSPAKYTCTQITKWTNSRGEDKIDTNTITEYCRFACAKDGSWPYDQKEAACEIWKQTTTTTTTTLSATCDSYTCPSSKPVNKGVTVFCSGSKASCDAATCCEARATCDTYICSSFEPVNKGSSVSCSGSKFTCDVATCCESQATCNVYSCPVSKPVNKGTSVLCSGNKSSCSEERCCDPPATCQDFSCPSDKPVKLSSAKCKHDATSCDVSTCCEEPATCENYNCPVSKPVNKGSSQKCEGNSVTCDATTCCGPADYSYVSVGWGQCADKDGTYESIGWACEDGTYITGWEPIGKCKTLPPCEEACNQNPECAAIGFHQGHCWMYQKRDGKPYVGTTSAYVWVQCFVKQ